MITTPDQYSFFGDDGLASTRRPASRSPTSSARTRSANPPIIEEVNTMLNHVLFVDIETVPDRDLMPPDQTTFPKPIHHRVVAISFVKAQIEREQKLERYIVECCRTGGEADYDEK